MTTVALLGRDSPVADALATLLEAQGWEALASLPDDGAIDALAVVAPPALSHVDVLEIDDAQLEATLDRFLDLYDTLRDGVARVRDGGAVVVVAGRGHLGGWHGAHEMAFAGALAGLMRSVSLENAARGVRANLVAAELPDARAAVAPEEVAALAAFLLSPESAAVNGELVLANHGRSLQIREASERPSPSSSNPTP